MKLNLPRRRWLVLAGCLAVIGFGLVLIQVKYIEAQDVEAQGRHRRMVAGYERVRLEMTRSEVRGAFGQLPGDVWYNVHNYEFEFDPEQVVKEEVPSEGQIKTWDYADVWIDHGLCIFVKYRGRKAVSKELVKSR
jgi:hypothetical protein